MSRQCSVLLVRFHPTTRSLEADSGYNVILFTVFPCQKEALEPVKSRIPPTTAGSGSFLVTAGSGSFLKSFGPCRSVLAGSGSFLKAQEGPGTEMQGIIGTIPMREKFRENPYNRGSGTRKEGPRGPSFRLSSVPDKPAQAPTPGPLIWPEEPDPEKHAFYTLFRPFSDSFFWHPLPLAPLFVKSAENMVWKRVQLYRLLRLLLRTSKMALDPGFWDGKWPILWHI